MSGITCPFCGMDDFDLLGLKMHYARGFCEEYEAIDIDVELGKERKINHPLSGTPQP